MPKRWERYGTDLMVLPPNSFASQLWLKTLSSPSASASTSASASVAGVQAPAAGSALHAVYALWCECFRVQRLALSARIRTGLKRESATQIVFVTDSWRTAQAQAADGKAQVVPGAGAGAGWVVHRENGIAYGFDVTKVMFSSGNGTEKSRIAKAHIPYLSSSLCLLFTHVM